MKKLKNDEVEYIENRLIDLKGQLDNIDSYLKDNVWTNLTDEGARRREFKFQAELFNKYITWLEDYTKLSGLVEFYNSQKEAGSENLRKGYTGNELMDMLKTDSLEENIEEHE